MTGRAFRPGRRGIAAVLGPLEADVMETVWAAGTAVTVSDVTASFHRKRRKLAYSTLKTILTNLAAKGYLTKRAIGRANEFAAKKTKADLEKEVVGDVCASLMRDYRSPVFAHWADELARNPEATAELERLIAQRRAASRLRARERGD